MLYSSEHLCSSAVLITDRSNHYFYAQVVKYQKQLSGPNKFTTNLSQIILNELVQSLCVLTVFGVVSFQLSATEKKGPLM